MLSANIGNGLIADLGAELINTDHADMLALAEEFGIALFNRKADSAASSYPSEAYFFSGKSYNEAELADDLRAIATQIAADRRLARPGLGHLCATI